MGSLALPPVLTDSLVSFLVLTGSLVSPLMLAGFPDPAPLLLASALYPAMSQESSLLSPAPPTLSLLHMYNQL